MKSKLEIKPGVGLSSLLFGASMEEAEKKFGKPEDAQLIDDIEEFQTTVWHYWESGFTLFFDEQNNKLFNCAEIDNEEAQLWGKKVFELKEKQIIDLFRENGITLYESEQHDWGEKRLSFDEANIDFYFEKNRLVSINFCKPLLNAQVLILKN
ncbi:MAG: hypothetical protein WAQ28_03560 [Bacteroidia bacterium]|jgi:TRAP-type C4-dicarboxylate transport system substrate-binding protein